MCSRNTVRASSHISFFCGRDRFCEVVRRPENRHEELTGLLERPAGLSPSLERPLDLHLQSKITDLIFSLKSQTEIWTSSLPHVFSVYGWLSELTYFRFFSGNLLILSANRNICHSIHRQ